MKKNVSLSKLVKINFAAASLQFITALSSKVNKKLYYRSSIFLFFDWSLLGELVAYEINGRRALSISALHQVKAYCA